MTAIIPANFGGVSTKFAQQQVADDLSSGIQSSFGLIGYKGKVWSIRYRGDEKPLMRDDGDGPRGSIEVVILNASKAVSKIWYEQGYVEGSNAAPDCFSNNGVTPEPTAAKKQCESCAVCPHNQWGSRITPAGKSGKACADSKRLAVAPLDDINNEMFGGPMLLRVPAASLQDVAMYGQKMQQMGYPYFAVGTRISFDPAESYPKFIFNAIRPLNDDEADKVLALRDGHQVERILSENEFAPQPVDGPTQQQLASAFEQPPAETKTIAADVQKAKADTDAKAKAELAKKAAAEKKAKADAAAKAKADAEAAAAAVTSEGNDEESEEDREIREMEERMAAMKAKKLAAVNAAKQATAASSSQSAAQDTGSTSGQTATIDASPSEEDDDAPASGFEAELDDMLNGLL